MSAVTSSVVPCSATMARSISGVRPAQGAAEDPRHESVDQDGWQEKQQQCSPVRGRGVKAERRNGEHDPGQRARVSQPRKQHQDDEQADACCYQHGVPAEHGNVREDRIGRSQHDHCAQASATPGRRLPRTLRSTVALLTRSRTTGHSRVRRCGHSMVSMGPRTGSAGSCVRTTASRNCGRGAKTDRSPGLRRRDVGTARAGRVDKAALPERIRQMQPQRLRERFLQRPQQ